MNTVTLSIPHDHIKAALICAAKQDVRYYLVGVALDLTDATKPRLVSTDGHRMLILDATPYMRAEDGAYAGVPADMIGQVYILPRELLSAVKPVKAGRHGFDIKITIGQDGMLSIAGATTATGGCIDGRYPEWRSVFPSAVSGEVIQFNWDYLADMKSAAVLLFGTKDANVALGHNGAGPALIDFGRDTAVGVIMPIRPSALPTPTAVPSWV